MPESSYNSRVREILDKFEPRALYFCDAKYFDEVEELGGEDKIDVEHVPVKGKQTPYFYFDICKS